jgi:hypothetical protein
MAIGESVTGTGSEVAFEATSQVAGFEGDVELYLPGSVLGSVATLASVVLPDAFSQV